MSATAIGWIVSIFFVVVLIACFFVGFWRGLKKSTANLVFSVVGALVAFFVTPAITGAILEIQINFDGENITLSQYLINLISSDESLSVIMDRNPNIETLVQGLPNAIASTVVFLLVVLAVELVMYIIYRIIACFTFKTSLGTSKRRVWGGVIGLAKGFVLTLFAFMPLAGLIGTYSALKSNDVSYINTNSQISSASIVDEIPPEIDEILTGLENNALIKICGVFGLDNATFDYLSEVEVEGNNIYIRQEIVNLYPIANLSYQMLGSENVTINFADINYTAVEQTLDNLVEGGLYKSILVNFANDLVLNYQEYPFISNSQDFGIIEDVLVEVQETLANSQNSEMLENYFTNDIQNLFSAVRSLGENGTLDQLISQTDVDVMLETLLSEANIQSTESALNNLLDMNMVRDAIVPLTNFALAQLPQEFDQVGSDTSSWGEQDWDDLASSIVSIASDYKTLSDTIDFEQVISTPEILVQDTSYNINNITTLLGNLIDEARSIKLLQTSSGTSILDSFLTNNGFSLPTELVKFVDSSGQVQALAINDYSTLLRFISPALVTIQENDLYNTLSNTSDPLALMNALADLISQEGNENLLSDIILPLSQVEPTKSFVVEEMIKTINNNLVSFADLNTFEEWQMDLGYVSDLLVTLSNSYIGEVSYLEYALNGDIDSILSNVTELELNDILLPILYAKSTQGLREDMFTMITDAVNSFTNTQNTLDLNITLVEGATEDQALEICDVFASFLNIKDEFETATSLKDLNKDNLSGLLTDMQTNAYRTTYAETLQEEGLFQGLFESLVGSLKSEYQTEIAQSSELQQELSEENYPYINFTEIFDLLSQAEGV